MITFWSVLLILSILFSGSAFAQEIPDIGKAGSDEELEDGYYLIASAMNSSKLLHPADGSGEDDVHIEIWDDYDLLNEVYYIEKQSDGYYKIVNRSNQKSLNVRDASSESGAELQQKEYDATIGQKWTIQKTPQGHYMIASGLGTYIDCAGADTQNGTRILLCDKNDGLNQQWNLIQDGVFQNQDVRTGVYTIASVLDDNKWLTFREDEEEIIVWDNTQYERQSFFIEKQEAGYYKILSSFTEKALSVRDASHESGAKLRMSGYNDTEEQRWDILLQEDGTVQIRSAYGTCLDCSEARTENGNPILVRESTSERNQRWFLLPQGNKIITYNNPAGMRETKDDLETGYYSILSAMDPSKVLHPVDDQLLEKTQLELMERSRAEYQDFYFENNGDGTYFIRFGDDGYLSLDVRDASPESGALLQIKRFDATVGQRWRLLPSGDKDACLIQSELGTCLDCHGASSENGTLVNMVALTDSVNQQWILDRATP